MALSKALEKVSVKIDFQTYNDRDSTFKNEVTEVVDNIVQDSKSSGSYYYHPNYHAI